MANTSTGGTTADVPALYLVNLGALVITGVLLCGWLLWYTEWFPVIGGLLGLGGLFAWVAFVVGLLAKPRKEAMQALFEDSVLLHRRTTFICGGLVLGVALLTLMGGTVILDTEAETVDRMVSVYSSGEPATLLRQTRLPARGERRLWFFSPPWGRTLRVKVTGLPAVEADLQPPIRRRLRVPATFRGRPLLLVRPDLVRSGSLARAPEAYELRVSLGGRTASLTPYGGQTVWIGTDADVPIPPGLRDRWRDELTMADVEAIAAGSEPAGADAIALVLARWAAPRAILSDAPLQPGVEATIEIVRRNDRHALARVAVRVQPAHEGVPVQEILLR